MKKWTVVIILGVLGLALLGISIEYLTTAIPHLPSFLPGHFTATGSKGHSHNKIYATKRGYFALFLAIVSFGGAGYLAFKMRQQDKAAAS